ncbi:MAG: 3'-5' exonuclease [Candidatus Shikimatogenerans sp. Tmey]
MSIIIYNSLAGTGKTFNLIKKFIFLSIKKSKINNIILSYTNYSINNIKKKILLNLLDIINFKKKNKILKYLIKKKIKYKIIKTKSIKILKNIINKNNILTIDKFIYNIIINNNKKFIIKNNNFKKKINKYLYKYIYTYNIFFNKKKKNKYYLIFKKKINYLLNFKFLFQNINIKYNINYIKKLYFIYKNIKNKYKKKIYKEIFYNNYILYIINIIINNKIFINKLNFYFYEKYIKKYKIFPNIWNNIIIKYNNFFIDEYQDLSKYQYKNLKSLFKEIVYNNKKINIYLYSDTNQSIYNWINNNYNYNYIYNKIIYFNTNYRHYRKIFIFNKYFLKFLYKKIFIYNNIYLLKNKIKKKGSVYIYIYKYNSNIKIYKIILNKIKKIKNKKYCILIRNNNQKKLILKLFYKKKKYIYILKFLIYFFKIIIKYNKKYLLKILFYLKKIKIINKIFLNINFKKYNIYQILLKYYNINICKNKIFNKINNIYHLSKYLLYKIKYNKTYNIINLFYKYNNINILNFIKQYKINKKKIIKHIIKNKKINILTIHKSKNLEFNIIFLLLLNNKNSQNRFKWIYYKKNILFIKKKIFYSFFNKKKISIYTINLLYVALTRAKKKLYIYIYKKNIYYKYLKLFINKYNFIKKIIKIFKI